MTVLLIAAILAASAAANLLAAHDARLVIVNAFFLVALDLVARDRLHTRWTGPARWLGLSAVAIAGAAVAYAVNTDAHTIAVASAVAFAAAFAVDALAWALLGARPWVERSIISNVPSAAIDSIVFPLLAFGTPLSWQIAFGLFAAKVGGGALWATLLQPRRRAPAAA